ncbi:hypothetical protein FDH38_gp093 [Dinoroseobacter phage vB_DshS-R5C]|uniref:Uncharacterized protein n=1 Tax=Dinoroseobacter phage vB_DshS-R5C TaxID=1965368 RepID=A0A1V0DYE5_9CAUD|nr:hypothetical protein FDH38_gp093 [Dinoroseobacter phage vB_DshS-R5C]ARB06147.1 hypothetical protein vBDshSR5C_93 [Dinoroseobacter phage vB_DshS-R5C]
MKTEFNLIRPACDFAGVISTDASVHILGGRMETANKKLIVSQPVDGLPDMTVAAVDLDFVLRKMPDVESVKVNKTFATLNPSTGSSTRIKLMPDGKPYKKPDIETTDIVDIAGLLNGIDEVLPFSVGDPTRPWSEGARFDGTKITATNSTMLIQANMAESCGLDGITISREALQYIAQRGDALKAWGVSERGILLEYHDGGWALVARMSMEMPDNAVTMINGINDWSDMQEVDDEYRAALEFTSDFAEKAVEIHADKIFGARYSSEHDEPATTNLGDVDKAVFDPKNLVLVARVANEIGFDRYPNPVPFTTPGGSKGLIAGLIE